MSVTKNLVVLLILLLNPLFAYALGSLENPKPSSSQSGISVVSGWHCNANTVEIQFDDRRRIPAAYPTERRDTETTCGDVNNGFVFLFNYGLLGDGPHTVRVYADGVQFDSATFNVTTLGESFVRGLSKNVTVPDFPEAGDATVLVWEESKQNFSFKSVQKTGSPPNSAWDVQRYSLGGVDFEFHLEEDAYGICYMVTNATNTTSVGKAAILLFDVDAAPDARLAYWSYGYYIYPNSPFSSKERAVDNGCNKVYSWSLNLDYSLVYEF